MKRLSLTILFNLLIYYILSILKVTSNKEKKKKDWKKVDFYDGQIEKVNGLKGFVIINNFEDNQKAVNISFWEK